MAKHKHSMYLVVLVTLMILFGLVVILDGCSKLVTDGDLTGEVFSITSGTNNDHTSNPPTLNTQGCSDTDATKSLPFGKNIKRKGTACFKDNCGTDTCISKRKLREFHCSKKTARIESFEKACNCYKDTCK